MPYGSSDDEEFSSGEEELSDEEEVAVALAQQQEKEEKREAIYNADVMHDKLEDIAWTQDQAWEETLAITSTNQVQVENVDDDLERELAFYNQALEAAKSAIGRFESAGAAWQRPSDYYAEMVKTDEHMAKVKEQLLYEQRQIEGSEQRRKEREAKKFGKQVSAERKKERAQEKKKNITEVSKLRKQREKSGFAGELDMDKELEKMEGGGRGRKRPAPTGTRFEAREQSKKREGRDSKFGFGGPKRLKKQNDASSAADMDGYRPSRFDDGIGGGRGRGGGRGGRGGRGGGRDDGGRGGGRGRGGGGRGAGGGRGGSRPGKDQRQGMRGSGGRGGGSRGGGGRGGGGRGGGGRGRGRN